MRIIAVMSPKGGIGKTTTSDAIAYMLGEEQEKRVLILDGDPRAIHPKHSRHTSRREQE